MTNDDSRNLPKWTHERRDTKIMRMNDFDDLRLAILLIARMQYSMIALLRDNLTLKCFDRFREAFATGVERSWYCTIYNSGGEEVKMLE